MTDKTKPKITATHSINVEVGTTDLVAVRVAKVERELTKERKEVESKLKALEKEAKTKSKSLDKAAESLVATQIPEIKNAVNAMEAVGLDGPSTEITLEREERKVKVKISDGGSYHSKSTKRVLEATDEMCNDLDRLEKIEEEATELGRDLVDIRRQLGQIATVERQARAAIATKMLRDVDGGQALLEAAEGGDFDIEADTTLKLDDKREEKREENAG